MIAVPAPVMGIILNGHRANVCHIEPDLAGKPDGEQPFVEQEIKDLHHA